MNSKDKKRKLILFACNIILIVATIIATWIYSDYIYNGQREAKKIAFVRTVESMKQVSQNYFDNESRSVKNWANYITANDMTLEQALDFLRSINTSKERFAHIIDMDTYEAYSAYYPKGKESIDTYIKYKEGNIEAEVPFGKIMEGIYNGTSEEFAVVGKYRLQETKGMGIGIGARVTIATTDGTKDYLLLRVSPIEVIKKSWVFPLEYPSAEVGVITTSGDYVIQSTSMKSQNFREYIRGYNFVDDYNEVEKLKKKLQTTDSGMMEYKNFRGEDCLWYYSSFGENSSLDILGVINKDELKASIDAWYIIFIVCGILIVLAFVDGAYLISINHRLREAARISEEASKAKTQFLSAMSHDIRTPLNAVLGMMEIAQKKSDDPQKVEECMEKGMHSGKQLLTLINDVLDISKIESGKLTLNSSKINLVEFIEDIAEIQEKNILKKDIRFKRNFEPLPYKYVYGDRIRLNQICINLLTNAVKYTPAGGKITLLMYEEAIPGDMDNIRLVYYVEDTGIGMTEEFQKHMYSMFERETKTQVNTTQGTGLGLSIVKQMVDLMGGTIECKSESGVGTSFKVTIDLPIVKEISEINTEDIQNLNIADLHLLIAEDNEINWEIVKELLAGKNVSCDRATNGQVCVEMLKDAKAGTYDAILMDIHMPIMNGYQATREIRSLEDEDKNKIPIFAMTADAFAEDVRKCLDCGMNGHIEKPINMDKIMKYLWQVKSGQV